MFCPQLKWHPLSSVSGTEIAEQDIQQIVDTFGPPRLEHIRMLRYLKSIQNRKNCLFPYLHQRIGNKFYNARSKFYVS